MMWAIIKCTWSCVGKGGQSAAKGESELSSPSRSFEGSLVLRVRKFMGVSSLELISLTAGSVSDKGPS